MSTEVYIVFICVYFHVILTYLVTTLLDYCTVRVYTLLPHLYLQYFGLYVNEIRYYYTHRMEEPLLPTPTAAEGRGELASQKVYRDPRS